MKQYLCCYLAIALIFLTACTSSSPPPQEPISQLKVVTVDNTVKIVRSQTVYVPVYSHIYYLDRERKREFATTLSIRNTDLTNPIIITSVSYYNTNGERVRKYLEQPVELKPLAATDIVVNLNDTSGGVGASFIVEWVAQKQVSDPVIEAVMIHTPGNQGLSLISNGRVIKSWNANNK